MYTYIDTTDIFLGYRALPLVNPTYIFQFSLCPQSLDSLFFFLCAGRLPRIAPNADVGSPLPSPVQYPPSSPIDRVQSPILFIGSTIPRRVWY